MLFFEDRHVEVGDCWGWGHSHRNAFVLFDDNIVESHTVVQHN